ncbi:MAG: hypothetical protein ACXVXY_07185 [Mycobacteriaceae bacterium]
MNARPNVSWAWPDRVAEWRWAHRCARGYGCGWESTPVRTRRNDVKRCRHGRLHIARKVDHSPDSNGGLYQATWRRLRPWRIAYWRARSAMNGGAS